MKRKEREETQTYDAHIKLSRLHNLGRKLVEEATQAKMTEHEKEVKRLWRERRTKSAHSGATTTTQTPPISSPPHSSTPPRPSSPTSPTHNVQPPPISPILPFEAHTPPSTPPFPIHIVATLSTPPLSVPQDYLLHTNLEHLNLDEHFNGDHTALAAPITPPVPIIINLEQPAITRNLDTITSPTPLPSPATTTSFVQEHQVLDDMVIETIPKSPTPRREPPAADVVL